jgi:hypothetical protein
MVKIMLRFNASDGKTLFMTLFFHGGKKAAKHLSGEPNYS